MGSWQRSGVATLREALVATVSLRSLWCGSNLNCVMAEQFGRSMISSSFESANNGTVAMYHNLGKNKFGLISCYVIK